MDTKTLTAIIVAMIATVLLSSCVSVPLPPTGEDAGKWGYVDVKISYRPNIDSIVSAFSKPNPDIEGLSK